MMADQCNLWGVEEIFSFDVDWIWHKLYYRLSNFNQFVDVGAILYTYTVSMVTYTDEYRACIWTSLGEFRYERYESVYVTLLSV